MIDLNELFAKNNIKVWKSSIPDLVSACNSDRECLIIIGVMLTRDLIPDMMSPMVSNHAAHTWVRLWREFAGKYVEFEMTLEILDAVVQYKETSYDKRAIMPLPREIRELIIPLLPKARN